MIDDKLANTLIGLLKASFGMPTESFRYEIQDDWKLLLVSIVFDPMVKKSEIQRELILAQELASGIIPSRHGDYTWMINAVQEGVVVESIFGGDSASPSSGML
ncbi:hypothetical protein M5C99_13540 [Acidovorax sp. NCPPB 2350]|nr:hypothetical protein M5C99_13540 [Acidovorax sp. NCPPB 2350]